MRTPWWPSMRPGRQPLAGRSRDAYLAQMRGFLTWLAGSEHGGAALVEPGVRDRAVRDYKRHVQTARHWAPSTVNQALAAIDSFYRSIGVGRPEVAREELARVIDLIIRRLAKDAHLELSAHTLLEGPSMTAVGTSHRARRGRPAAAEVRPAGLRHLLSVVVAGARCGRATART